MSRAICNGELVAFDRSHGAGNRDAGGDAAAPTLCIHGTKNNYVPFEQAGWIVDRLKAAGVEAELLPMEGSGHGFNGEAADAAMLAFFDAHLKKK